MKILKTNHLDNKQKATVLALWNNEYPSQLAYPDIDAFNEYLDNLQNQLHYLLIIDDDHIGAWAFTFTRDESQWFAIIVDGSYQRKGFGSTLLTALKSDNSLLNGWATDHDNYIKVDGSIYTSPLEFYLKNGFILNTDERFETNLISAVKISYHLSGQK